MTVRPRHLNPLHIALAFLIVAVWGTNFVVIKMGLEELPPFLFVALRFAVCAFPFALFIPRPRVAWRWLAAYGIVIGAGQFALLFYAMRADISPGMASLVIQVQVFFTIALSMWIFGEKTTAVTWVGTLLAAAGLVVIAFHLDATITAVGVAIVVTGALAWALGNIVVKHVARQAREPVNMLAFMVWSSIFAVPPLVLMSLTFEGWSSGLHGIANASPGAWAAVAWQAVGNTLFGYAAWSWLLTRYDAAVIAPYALLIPIFGMGSSALLLGEPLPPWKLVAAAMVLGGITLITLVGRRRLTGPRG
jgi:O-acetylserine/cysteine efflux transporter